MELVDCDVTTEVSQETELGLLVALLQMNLLKMRRGRVNDKVKYFL